MKPQDKAFRRLITGSAQDLRRATKDSDPVTRKVARTMLTMDDWDESKHPRGKGGKFAPKGSAATSGATTKMSAGGGGENKSESFGVKSKPSKPSNPSAPPKPQGSAPEKSIEGSGNTLRRAAKRLGGNFGHQGRKGFRGGSAKSGTGGLVTGNMGRTKSGEVIRGKDYSLNARGLQSKGRTGSWSAVGKPSKQFPNGSGTTRISEGDIWKGVHTIGRYVQADGSLSPERAALHDKVVNELFAGKKPVGPGEQKTFYFLGGGSASGKGSFTNPSKAARYDMPDKSACAVIDADELKKSIPEYNEDTGTTDREKAASFAHEESSALAKRAMEAAFANGYNCTLDGTGDGSVKGVLKKIAQARKAGYKVEARYCTASIDTALQRNLDRAAKTGRKVQKDSVVRIHKSVSEIFPQVASEFDHVTLWDHNGAEPKMIAECHRGQDIQIYDKKLYDDFLAKKDWNG